MWVCVILHYWAQRDAYLKFNCLFHVTCCASKQHTAIYEIYSILLALCMAASAVKAACRCYGRGLHLIWMLIPSYLSNLQFVNFSVTYSLSFSYCIHILGKEQGLWLVISELKVIGPFAKTILRSCAHSWCKHFCKFLHEKLCLKHLWGYVVLS